MHGSTVVGEAPCARSHAYVHVCISASGCTQNALLPLPWICVYVRVHLCMMCICARCISEARPAAPIECRSSQVRSSQVKLSEADRRHRQLPRLQVQSNPVKSSWFKSSQVKSSQVKSNECRSSQVKSSQVKLSEADRRHRQLPRLLGLHLVRHLVTPLVLEDLPRVR